MSERPATSPPPPADGTATGPTPQTIGIRFVKAYYQTLSTTPDQIFKFYKPSSFLSHGEGSTPSSATGFESYQLGDRWGDAQRFDFDNGAIDAQPSANGSILLVVTGRVVVKVDGEEARKGFVQTFLLALVSLPNKQKTYYVHNDILRFLKADVKATEPETSTSATVEATSEEETKTVEAPALVEEAPKEEARKQESPSGGVEETKEDTPEEEPLAEEAPTEQKTDPVMEDPAVPDGGEQKKKGETATKDGVNAGGGKGKRQRGRGKSPAQQNAQKQQPASKPAPGSWASLVASGSGPTPTPTTAPSKTAAPEKPEAPLASKPSKSQPKKEEKNESANGKENGKGSKDKPKRDPDNTLVVKNLPDETKEADLLAIFEKFAVETNSKIVSSTISSHRGLAFVDYDSVAPVMAAVKQHGKEPIQLNGRVLEVDQKTAEQRARKARGGGYRSGSPNQNNRSGGGGRQNKRDKGSGGRGGNKGNRGGGTR